MRYTMNDQRATGGRLSPAPSWFHVHGRHAAPIAKLDRLSRNAAFLLTLRDSGVRFVAADMPEANDLTVGIMELVAEQEREAISRRTREALAAVWARGCALATPTGPRP